MTAADQTPGPSHRDPSRSPEQRADALLALMTLEEKAGQLTQYFYLGLPGGLPEGLDPSTLPPEHQVFLQQPAMVEAAITAGTAGSVLFVKDVELANRLQRLAVEDTRLGIPLLFGFDVIHGWRTIFPVPIALAATWSPRTAVEVQTIAAREARAAGVHWSFAPMIDVARDPRWGRIVEGAGEDPFLGSAMAAAQVRGFQGDLGQDRVLAGPKHFAGYGAARGGRDYDDAEVSDSELWNVYFPPFRAAVAAGAENVMSAYMDLNGVPASGNRWLLTEVLREELGFDGFVVSDANAVRSLKTQHFAQDLTDAAARAVGAGLDMEMVMFDPAFAHLPEAVTAGTVHEDEINVAVRRVLTVKFKLGLFEQPFADATRTTGVLEAPGHRDAAQVAAERSVVLLKNQGLLPLSAKPLRSVAVIGTLADSRRDVLGPWVFEHDIAEAVTIVAGLGARLGAGVQLGFESGAGIPARVNPSPFDRMEADPASAVAPPEHDDDTAIERAVKLAAGADVAIVVVGERQNQIGEAASTDTLELPGRQLEQLQRVVATGTPVVLVVMSGRPLDLRWADENVPAIVQAWYPGTRGGDAVASVLLGDVSPAGRLPFTWPRHVGQVPLIYSHLRTFAPQDQDARYSGGSNAPLYPFGHGLSYAKFTYRDLRVAPPSVIVGETSTVSVDVTNTSDRTADEVVQLYVHQRHGTSSRPVRELKGFERVTLSPYETRTVTFPLGADQLSYWSSRIQGFVQDATTLDVWVGGTSTADLHIELEVTT